jgi:hypothetical protein
MRKLLILVSLLLFICVPMLYSAPITIKVKLLISAEGLTANQLESYINRELRKLGDVSTVFTGSPDFELRLSAMPIKTVSGKPMGYSVAYLLVSPIAEVWKEALIESSRKRGVEKEKKLPVVDPNNKAAPHSLNWEQLINGAGGWSSIYASQAAETASKFYMVEYFSAGYCGADGLESLCRDLIVTLDSQNFQIVRIGKAYIDK